MNQEVLNLTTFLDACPKNFMESGASKGKAKRKERSSSQLGTIAAPKLESLLMVITFHSLEEKLVS